MPSECDIKFDHPNGVYNSGEILNGSIELRTNSSKTIRGVCINIKGYGKVRWSESRSRRRNGKTEHYTVVYSAHEQYLNSVTFVIGSDGARSFELAPGTYNHTFTCALPSGVPTSCQGQYGEIKYEVIVTIDRPMNFDNVFRQGFTVLQPLNLNLDPSLKLPQVSEDMSTACGFCCCSGGGKISAELHVKFKGYVPGQKIEFQMFVFNESNNDLDRVQVKFEKRITFESSTPTRKQRHSETEIDTKRFGPILRLTRKEFKDSIRLPSIPPSSTNPGQCVRIHYLLKGKVQTGCCANNIHVSIPITIGTVPIMESATNPANIITQQPTAPIIDQNNGIGNGAGAGSDLPPAYMSVAPPSYEDSLSNNDAKFKDDENNDNHKEMPFTPKYPVYHNFAGIPTAPRDVGTPENPSAPNYGWSSRQ